MDTPDELALLAKARLGDRRALAALLATLEPSVYKFGLKLCGDEEAAREVLQDTLIATVRHLDGFRGDSSLTTWLYTVARSVCIKRRRRSKFAPVAVERLEPAAEATAALSIHGLAPERPDDSFERAELGAQLEAAIAALEPRYREVLVLRDVEGLSAAEVAEALDLTVEAVKSRLHRARTRVRAALAPHLGAAAPAPGPACPDVATMFSARLEGDIAPETCTEMEQHLASCPSCRAVCHSLRRTLKLCAATRQREVPAALQESVRRAVQDFAHLLKG
jgi:RNA polymerase sigma-70 factor (ECF subfamily)